MNAGPSKQASPAREAAPSAAPKSRSMSAPCASVMLYVSLDIGPLLVIASNDSTSAAVASGPRVSKNAAAKAGSSFARCSAPETSSWLKR